MVFYILIFVILLIITFYFMKKNEKKMKDEEDNKKYIEQDYQLILIIFSIISILLIIYFKILLSDIFIRFINKYTSAGEYLEKLKNFFGKNNIKEVEKIKIDVMRGGTYKNIEYIVNNDLPLSDYSEISSIEL